MSFTKSYFNGSISMPSGQGIDFKSINGNTVTIISNANTNNNYTLVLPQSQGFVGEQLVIDSVFNNNLNLKFAIYLY